MTSPELAPFSPDILTVDELAQLLRVNRKTAYDAIARGEIPGVRRVGGVLRCHSGTVLEHRSVHFVDHFDDLHEGIDTEIKV